MRRPARPVGAQHDRRARRPAGGWSGGGAGSRAPLRGTHGDGNPRGVLTDASARLGSIDPERDLDRAARRGIRWIVPGDPEWPPALDDLQAGRAAPGDGRGAAGSVGARSAPAPRAGRPGSIVGCRSATTYGTDQAAELAAGLARAGSAVVSGAAFGIDQAAHRGALAGDGPTVAVLACGVDRAYPAAHQQLLDHLADHGAIVSELAPGCAPMRPRFLARNRVIAALGRGTVVVEAAARSGSLNTASWAARIHRPVMGVPGPVTSATSQGVHALIRSGAATLVTGPADVLELVGAMGQHLLDEPRGPTRRRDRLTRRQRQVLDAVPVARRHRPTRSPGRPGLGLVEVRSALDALLRRELVVQTPRGWRLADGADQG